MFLHLFASPLWAIAGIALIEKYKKFLLLLHEIIWEERRELVAWRFKFFALYRAHSTV